MQQKTFIQNQDEFPDTHFFAYRGKKYPIKYDFFKLSSKFFSRNYESFEPNQVIPLIDQSSESSVNLTDESIQMFINFVHHKQVPIDNENVVSLNYLANIYEISSLIKFTNDYISENHRDLALQILLMHQNDEKFDTKVYETVLSENLPFYVKDDRLLDLKISTLYRICTEFFRKSESQKEINEFLFKCLDKFGKEASSLFAFVDFGKSRNECLERLLNGYSEIFDFHFINSQMLKSLYEQQNETIKNDERNRMLNEKSIKDLRDEIERIKSENSQ